MAVTNITVKDNEFFPRRTDLQSPIAHLTSVGLTEVIGWASSFILVLTLARQVQKQWASGESEGISTWLFVGQMAASVGFAVYSWLLGNRVFVFTNSLMVVNGLVGYLVLQRNRRRQRSAGN